MYYFEKAEKLWQQAAAFEREAYFQRAYLLYTYGCEQAVHGLRLTRNEVLLNEYAMKVRYAMMSISTIRLYDTQAVSIEVSYPAATLQYREISSAYFGDLNKVQLNEQLLAALQTAVILPARFPSLYTKPATPIVVSGLELTGKTTICQAVCAEAHCRVISVSESTDFGLLQQQLERLSLEISASAEQSSGADIYISDRPCIVYHDFRYILDYDLLQCLQRAAAFPRILVVIECYLECLSAMRECQTFLTDFGDRTFKASVFYNMLSRAGIYIDMQGGWLEVLQRCSIGAVEAALEQVYREYKKSLILNTRWIEENGCYRVAKANEEAIIANFFSLYFGSVKYENIDPQRVIDVLATMHVTSGRWNLFSIEAKRNGILVDKYDNIP